MDTRVMEITPEVILAFNADVFANAGLKDSAK